MNPRLLPNSCVLWASVAPPVLWRGGWPEASPYPLFLLAPQHPCPAIPQRGDQAPHCLWDHTLRGNPPPALCPDLLAPCSRAPGVTGEGAGPTHLIHHQVVIALVFIALLGDTEATADLGQAPATMPLPPLGSDLDPGPQKPVCLVWKEGCCWPRAGEGLGGRAGRVGRRLGETELLRGPEPLPAFPGPLCTGGGPAPTAQDRRLTPHLPTPRPHCPSPGPMPSLGSWPSALAPPGCPPSLPQTDFLRPIPTPTLHPSVAPQCPEQRQTRGAASWFGWNPGEDQRRSPLEAASAQQHVCPSPQYSS